MVPLTAVSNVKFKLSGSLCKESESMFLFCVLPTWAETRSEAIKVLESGLVISSCSVQASVLCVEVFESSRELFELKGAFRKRTNDTGRFSVE